MDNQKSYASMLKQNSVNEVNQFIEDIYEYFYPSVDPDDYRLDMDYDHNLVADI